MTSHVTPGGNPRANGQSRSELWLVAMTQARAHLAPSGSPTRLATHLRPVAIAVVHEIVAEIEDNVPSYAPQRSERRRNLIGKAVGAAIERFLDTLADKPSSGPRVDDLFRKMGYGEATDGQTLEPLRSALGVAERRAWVVLRDFAVESDLDVATLGWLGEALLSYMNHLDEVVTQGYGWGSAAAAAVPVSARDSLTHALFAGASTAEIETLAEEADWRTLPEVVVLVARTPLPHVVLPDQVLTGIVDSRPVLVTSPGHAEALERQLHRAAPTLELALTWPVTLEQVDVAHRWGARALELAASNVLPASVTLHCLDHATQLWLHAEPSVRRRLAQELLQPLMAETPNSREILSETLLVWLETRDSAPAIAALLDVHPQTVRYRWKRINELFGENLHDAEFVLQLTMILKASLPLWKAGDQSDFERFRAGVS